MRRATDVVGLDPKAWRLRRAIRNVVWLVGGLLVVYLVANNLQQSRENERLLREARLAKADQVVDLASLLALVERAERAAESAGRRPAVTTAAAVEALKQAGFDTTVIDKAVAAAKAAVAATTTTTTRVTTTTGRGVTTTTRGPQGPPGPPGPPGPQGPPGADSGGSGGTPATTTTVPGPTTTTTRPCAAGLDLPGLPRLCLTGS